MFWNMSFTRPELCVCVGSFWWNVENTMQKMLLIGVLFDKETDKEHFISPIKKEKVLFLLHLNLAEE